ncbi:MAG TPA: sugar phosphate nucleotidyltransferase [Candidatus Bathyarchaeia archaeon]|nr:sugar phosphate nucleotidyltransferase [Candidatus Bathyarchaeia archaeon]
MKALILAAGRGKRLGNAYDQSKCMLEIDSKPLIEYSLDSAVATRAQELVIVVGHRADEIMKRYGREYRGRPIQYALQENQNGLVHAIECAEKPIAGEDFLLLLGDEIMLRPCHEAMIHQFVAQRPFAICGVLIEKRRHRISKTYSIIQDESRKICRLIEKPRNPANDWMGTGSCIFRNEIYSYVERTPLNQNRGERELPDLIQCAIDDGEEIKSFTICEKYFNINSPEDLREATENSLLLSPTSS